MKHLLLRLVRETDGFQLIYYALAGGGLSAVLIFNADLVADVLDKLAYLLRTFAAQLGVLW